MRGLRTLLWALISVLLCSAIAIVPASAVTSRVPARQAPGGDSSPASSLTDNPVIRQFVKTAGIDEIENQNALEAFRSWMFTQPAFSSSGYVGSIDNLRRKSMVLMWYGPPTPFLSAVLREGRSRGIKVGIQHRRYSLQQIYAATAVIWKQSAEGEWAGFKVSAVVGVSPSYPGITVEGTYTGLTESRRAAQVRALATTVSGVSVQVAPGTGVTLTSGRDADTAPFNAGGFMSSDNGVFEECSSGFAVALNDVPYTTTARHCPLEGGGEWVDVNASTEYSQVPAIERYGNTVELTSSIAGAAAILTGEGSQLMFSGAWNSASTLSVAGFGDVGVNDLVCTAGGNSGDHCDIMVTSLDASVVDADGSFETIKAVQQSSSNIAAMQGDSGGPVLSLANVSSGEVKAVGMIQAQGNPPNPSCPGNVNFPASCSSTVYFTSMRTIVKYTPGLTLVTVNGLISG